MANPIRCDYTDCPNLGDVLVTYLESGDTLAWCGPHYMEAISAAVEAAATAEADQADAAAIRALEAAHGPDDDEDDELDAAAVEARLGGPAVIEATDDAIRDDEARKAFAQEQVAADPTQPAHTIRRGQSAKAQAHRGRQATVLAAKPGLERAAGEPGFMEEPAAGDDAEDDAPTP